MKTEKLHLKTIKNVLSRTETKKIMAAVVAIAYPSDRQTVISSQHRAAPDYGVTPLPEPANQGILILNNDASLIE